MKLAQSAATALLVTRTERCALQQTIIFNRRFHSPDSIMGTLAPSFIPPQQQNAPLASRCHETRRGNNFDGEIAETLHFMVSPIGRRVCTFDDLLSCIEITLLFDEEDRILEDTGRCSPFSATI
ncbi:hypothetical protein GmHk_04G009768 [Glycine max]|nr:hypothetical protein GmHk_04G009768 [Glycine max]